MTTLNALAVRVLQRLNDTGESTWTETEVEGYAKDGLRDLSIRFPRVIEEEVTCTTGTEFYDLTAWALDVLSVRYPKANDPPEYLVRASRYDSDFWTRADAFDVEHNQDATQAVTLILPNVTTGNKADVRVTAIHDTTIATGDDITLPEQYEDVLIRYCVWQCWQRLATEEMVTPTSGSSLVMSQLASNAGRARRDYDRSLQFAMVDQAPSNALIWNWS